MLRLLICGREIVMPEIRIEISLPTLGKNLLNPQLSYKLAQQMLVQFPHY